MRKNKIAISIFAAVCVVSTIVGYSIIKQNESNNNNQLAVMTEQEDGTYIRSNMSAFGDGDYEFDHAVCNNGSTVTENSNGGVNLRLLGADKCTIYISKAKTVPEKIKKYAQSVEPDFTNGTETGIYTMEDDYGTSYYFRGDVKNNYVRFGDYIWRIVRLNGDGSLRIMYDGTTPHTNGEESTDRALTTSAFNYSRSGNAYVGYMYGNPSGTTYEEVHANTNDSAIKTYLDSWYETNIKNKGLAEYVSDTLFCNDRSVTSGTGIGTTSTDYGAYTRESSNTTPILTCPQKNDAFTVDDREKGNGALTYPIGLLTVDEYRLAGGKQGTNLYINKPGIDWWLGSPIYGGYAYVFHIQNNCVLSSNSVWDSLSVVPVINLSPDYVNQLKGSGTVENPYSTVVDKIKAKAQTVKPDFTNGTETGMYTMEDDYGTSYYYRGNITDNYVKFGDYIWRIVRINGDGSLRIIYDGTKPHANGESSNDRALAAPSKFNISNNSAYVGYMYGDINGETYDEVHANTNSSIIKTYLDKWYETNIRDKGLSKYVSDTIFCNDRSVTSGTGVGGTTTDFGAYDRRYTDPILTCPQKNDAFTVDDTENGNGALTYPIGLLTADEYRIASGTSESNTYITKPGITWWLGSPNRIDSGRTPYAYEFCVSTSGNLGDNIVDNTNTVVPVINLTVDYANQLAGTGTMNNPYTFK